MAVEAYQFQCHLVLIVAAVRIPDFFRISIRVWWETFAQVKLHHV